MLAPISWLKEYVKIGSVEKLAEELLLSGTKVEEIKKISGEVVFDFEITPNRPDTLGIYGIAREIAAVKNEYLQPVETEILVPTKHNERPPTLVVSDKKLCPNYTYGIIRGVEVKTSPKWLSERLQTVGIRPINNIVDITNYVMHELGQPMHAFDLDKIKGKITLRAAKEGEAVTTLDGIERKLKIGTIIIEDEEKLIDLAGLMGGESTQIEEKTRNILLHVPIYDPVAIRRASQQTALRTEASNRFEKKLDPAGHIKAFERAAKLINELASGTLMAEPVSVTSYKEKLVNFDFGLIKKVLGVEISKAKFVNILSSLGFQVREDPFKEDSFQVHVPSWRTDIEGEVDLTEEVGRIYGYNKLPKTLPNGTPPIQSELFDFDWEGFLNQSFKAAGFNQTMTHTLLGESMLKRTGFEPEKLLKLANPMSSDFEYLRPSMLPALLEAVVKNSQEKEISFFEIGRVFLNEELQPRKLSLVSTKSFPEVKGTLEFVLKKLDESPTFEAKEADEQLQERYVFKQDLAEIGLVGSKILSNFDIKSKVVFASINLEEVGKLNPILHYQPLPKYPAVIEDLSMFVDESITAASILDIVKKGKSVVEVSVFDIFKEGSKKSVAVRIYFQDKERTLTGKDVAKYRLELEKNLTKKINAEIRKN